MYNSYIYDRFKEENNKATKVIECTKVQEILDKEIEIATRYKYDEMLPGLKRAKKALNEYMGEK